MTPTGRIALLQVERICVERPMSGWVSLKTVAHCGTEIVEERVEDEKHRSLQGHAQAATTPRQTWDDWLVEVHSDAMHETPALEDEPQPRSCLGYETAATTIGIDNGGDNSAVLPELLDSRCAVEVPLGVTSSVDHALANANLFAPPSHRNRGTVLVLNAAAQMVPDYLASEEKIRLEMMLNLEQPNTPLTPATSARVHTWAAGGPTPTGPGSRKTDDTELARRLKQVPRSSPTGLLPSPHLLNRVLVVLWRSSLIGTHEERTEVALLSRSAPS